jgi:uncharacterized delta-60 repeat protein
MKANYTCQAFALGLLGCLSLQTEAQDQFLDSGFGALGIASFAVPSPAVVRSGRILSGSKILLVGNCGGNTAGTSNARTCLTRLNANGSVDTSFGVAGLAWPGDDGLSDFAFQAHEYADGSYLVSGSRQVHPNGHAAVLYRFLPNGNRDVSFGEGGRLVNPLNAFFKLETYSLAVDNQGRIYLAGLNTDLPSLNNQATIIRMLPDGRPDFGWNSNGIARIDFSAQQSDSFGGAITVLANGNVLVSGAVSATDSLPGRAVLALYSASGTLISSFGSTGVFSIDLTNGAVGAAASQFLESYLVDSQGRIWLFMSSFVANNQYEGAIVRLTENGALDASFGTNGLRRYRIGKLNTRFRRAIENNGQIYLAGNYQDNVSDNPSLPNTFITRLTNEGNFDPRFGIDGRVNITNRNLGLVQMFERQVSSGKFVLAFFRQQLSPNSDAYSAVRVTLSEGNVASIQAPTLSTNGLVSLALLFGLIAYHATRTSSK